MAAPDRAAVITDSETLTLADVNGQANAIAVRLSEIDAPANSIIALFMAHGSEKISAALGVLKASSAFVSVDPAHTDQGVRDLLSHATSTIVLADKQNHKRARRLAEPAAVVVDVSTLLDHAVTENPERTVTAESLLNISYTSGSTGNPKGVMRSHGSELSVAVSIWTLCKIGPGDRIAFFPGFWVNLLFGAMITGATIHPFALQQEGLEAMKEWLQRHHITFYCGILTGFRQLLATLQADAFFPDMRLVAVSGEPLHRADVERFDRAFPRDCAFMNRLASTEQHSMTGFSIDRRVLPTDSDIVPVGFPAPFLDVTLVDENANPVPPGAAGEITIRGTELSPGYWRNSELSAQVWRPDPATRGQRIFHSGDLAKLDANGCLRGLGRVDQQVKVRGHRVLPGEIENTLSEHPAIKAAVVVLDQVNFGTDRLVGYIVGETESIPTTSELRAYLGRRLPDYMVPSVFMPMPGFELTATGKVDRHALPPPKIDIEDRTGDAVAPANHDEIVLQEIWEELLDVQGISVEDDFFLIGGDSVMALTMFLQMEQRLGRQLPFESLWLHGSTIRALAMSITGQAPAANWDQALPLQTNGEKPVLFVVSMVSMPVYCLSLIEHLGADQPVYGLPAKGIGGDVLPDRRIEDMATHCLEMMRRVQPEGPYRIMGHSAAGLVAFEIARTLQVQGVEVSKLVILDSDMPGTAATLARGLLRKPFKAGRFAGSLLGQSLGLGAPDQPVNRKAARASAYFRYRPKPYTGGAILITSEERSEKVDLLENWRRLVTGDFIAAEVPGDHISMVQAPNVGKLARTLTRYLED